MADLTFFKRNAINYYGVFCSQYDKGNPYNDKLASIRRAYYESNHATQKKRGTFKIDNVAYRYSYRLSEDSQLVWKVHTENNFVEKSVPTKNGGYRVEVRDRSGTVLRKCIYFGTYHNWEKTKYFDRDRENPSVELYLHDENGITVILKYIDGGDDKHPDVLYPCAAVSDRKLLQKLTDKLGMPEVYCLCTNGLVYFAEHSIAKEWNKLSADPSLFNLTEAYGLNSQKFQQIKEFTPVNDNSNKSEQRTRIDLTQTQDFIIPNVVKSDSVVIHTKQSDDNSANNDSIFVPSRNINRKDLLDRDNEGLSQKTREFESVNPNIDPSDTTAANNEDSGYNLGHFKSPLQGTGNLDLDLDLDENENDNDDRVISDSVDLDYEHTHTIEPKGKRAYDYKRVRSSSDSAVNNSEFTKSLFEQDNSENKTKKNSVEDLKIAYENAKIAKQQAEESLIKQRGTDVSTLSFEDRNALLADKTIKVGENEVYYYFGDLNDEGKRDGVGRTSMKNGRTAYDGGYSEDMRDGFGVYYYKNGKICYVGEWENNHKNGVGTSYYHNDGTIHIGNWDNDLPVGMGAIFDKKGDLIFAGRWEGGTREGLGIRYNPKDGGIFVSCWENDTLGEKGTVFDSMGNLIYNGSWKNGTRNGIGTQYDKNGQVVYSGEWVDGKYNGEGSLTLSNGYKIVGEFVMGKVHGYAVVTTKKGKVLYEGQWKNNRYDGEGKLYNLKSGSWRQGTFSNGDPVGILSGYSKEGELQYRGEWQNGKYHGRGTSYANGTEAYSGEWQDGIKSGTGKEFDNGKCIYVGGFVNGMRSGFGTSFDRESHIIYSGLWTDNCYNGIGVLYSDGEPRLAGNFVMGVPNGRINEILHGRVVKECLYNNGECYYMKEYSDDGLALKYVGHVRNGQYEGMGCEFTEYGEKRFEGIFRRNSAFKNMKVRLKNLENLTYSDEMAQSEYGKYVNAPNYVIEQEYNGGVYSGLLVNGLPEGKGTILYTDHGYTGEFSGGIACGIGVIYEWDGSQINGTFVKQTGENTTEIVLANEVTYYFLNEQVQ